MGLSFEEVTEMLTSKVGVFVFVFGWLVGWFGCLVFFLAMFSFHKGEDLRS